MVSCVSVIYTSRGFEVLVGTDTRVQQGSAIGEYADALERPGSSFLWIGEIQYDRDEVFAALVNGLVPDDVRPFVQAWSDTGSLSWRTK